MLSHIVKYCSLQSQCEMKFAHIRVSEYFTFAEQIFHSEAISLARRANFIEKSTCLSKCFFLAGLVGVEPTRHESKSCVLPLDYSPVYIKRKTALLNNSGHTSRVSRDVGWEMGFEPTIFSATN